MPLIESDSQEAWNKNFAKEYARLKKEGKTDEEAKKQAAAIAWSIKRKAQNAKRRAERKKNSK